MCRVPERRCAGQAGTASTGKGKSSEPHSLTVTARRATVAGCKDFQVSGSDSLPGCRIAANDSLRNRLLAGRLPAQPDGRVHHRCAAIGRNSGRFAARILTLPNRLDDVSVVVPAATFLRSTVVLMPVAQLYHLKGFWKSRRNCSVRRSLILNSLWAEKLAPIWRGR